MPRRPDSPYTDQDIPDCELNGGYGTVGWKAQNEGQHINSLGLHFPQEMPINRYISEEDIDE